VPSNVLIGNNFKSTHKKQSQTFLNDPIRVCSWHQKLYQRKKKNKDIKKCQWCGLHEDTETAVTNADNEWPVGQSANVCKAAGLDVGM